MFGIRRSAAPRPGHQPSSDDRTCSPRYPTLSSNPVLIVPAIAPELALGGRLALIFPGVVLLLLLSLLDLHLLFKGLLVLLSGFLRDCYSTLLLELLQESGQCPVVHLFQPAERERWLIPEIEEHDGVVGGNAPELEVQQALVEDADVLGRKV
jgi:hypothetical protein